MNQNDPQQREWQKAPFKIDNAMERIGHASVIIDHYLVIVGGYRRRHHELHVANLVVFDMQKETCTQVEISGRKPFSRLFLSACYWKENQIIVYGGRNAILGDSLSEVGIITLSFAEPSIKAEWRVIETNSSIGSSAHTAYIYNNQMIVLCAKGINIRALNLDDFTWTEPETRGQSLEKLDWHTNVLYGNEIYVFGENSSPSQELDFWSLNLETYTWKKLPWAMEMTPSSTEKPYYVYAKIQAHKGKIYLLATHGEEQAKMAFKIFDISQGEWSSDLQLEAQGLFTGKYFTLSVYDNQLAIYGGDAFNDLWVFRLEDSEISKGSTENENIMKRFLREAPYSDVIFEVESEQIPAHKWWLCKRSKYFANMFSSGMMEAKSSKIVISDMTAATFRAFLEYLYADDVKLNVTLASDLLTQADKFSVPGLKVVCEQFLIGNLSTDNFVILANLSELLEANKLRDAVRDYIAKNIKMLKPRKDFEELSMDMLRDVIVKVTVR